MNFILGSSNDKIMNEGDLVILYTSHNTSDHIWLKSNSIIDNKYGHFYHDDFIGKKFGSKIKSRVGVGWLLTLQPTPELWATALNTRTQIVNSIDASIITFNLDLFPGCVVVESGTGSGNMTLAIARCVAPTGHIHTFEYNALRADAAREDFSRMGLGNLITVRHGDVCGKQFGSGGFEGVGKHSVDAVFLDLPEPWLALESAKYVLKPGRNICCYSPCMEQVMRTCDTLRKMGFFSVRMVEVRQRPFDAKHVQLEMPDVGRTEAKIIDLGPYSMQDREPFKRRKLGENISENEVDPDGMISSETSHQPMLDARSSNHSHSDSDSHSNSHIKSSSVVSEHTRPQQQPHKILRIPEPPYSVLCARPLPSMKGHSAFLMFAYSPIESDSEHDLSDKSNQMQSSDIDRNKLGEVIN